MEEESDGTMAEWVEIVLTDATLDECQIGSGRLLCLKQNLVAVSIRGVPFDEEGATCFGAGALVFVIGRYEEKKKRKEKKRKEKKRKEKKEFFSLFLVNCVSRFPQNLDWRTFWNGEDERLNSLLSSMRSTPVPLLVVVFDHEDVEEDVANVVHHHLSQSGLLERHRGKLCAVNVVAIGERDTMDERRNAFTEVWTGFVDRLP